MVVDLLTWLQATALAQSISEVWFPVVESLHVITVATVVGTIFIVDSRLVGFASIGLPFTYVSQRLLPWTWGAFACAVITGSLMFISNATGYYANVPFRVKMVLLGAAGLNMLYFQKVTFRKVSAWDFGRPSASARVAGSLSMGLWCSVIAFGRWIGFAVT